jgi:hypothetical protein
MQENAGPCAWAATVKDMTAEVKSLRDGGVTVAEPVKLAWEVAQIGPEPNGTFFPFPYGQKSHAISLAIAACLDIPYRRARPGVRGRSLSTTCCIHPRKIP